MKRSISSRTPYKLLLLGVSFLFAMTGCDKENTSRIRYEVQCPSGCQVVYKNINTMANREVSGNWNVSFRMDNDDFFFLSATKTTVLGNVTVKVSIDGESVAADQTGLPYGTAIVEGPVDRP